MSDLIHKLRDYQAMLDHMGIDNQDTGRAADEIERLREQNARLRAQIDFALEAVGIGGVKNSE